MKKSALPAALLLIGVGLGLSGCPVYDTADAGCYDDYDCPSNQYCDYPSGVCVGNTQQPPANSSSCNEPSDCGANETCSRSGICEEGDCSFRSVGCVKGFVCSGKSGRWTCVEQGSETGDAGAPNSSVGGAPGSSGAPSGGTSAEAGAADHAGAGG